MLYPLLLAAGLLTPALRPVVSVPAPRFTRPPLTAGRFTTPLPSRGTVPARFVTYSTSYTTTPGVMPDNADTLPGAEAQMLRLINAERATYGLSRLAPDYELTLAAQGHCRDMQNQDYFEHDSPLRGQRTPMDRYRFTLARLGERSPAQMTLGENIYYCSESNARYNVAYAHRALMNSPGHRANILNPCFTKAGIAVLRGADGELWVTEMFLKDSN